MMLQRANAEQSRSLPTGGGGRAGIVLAQGRLLHLLSTGALGAGHTGGAALAPEGVLAIGGLGACWGRQWHTSVEYITNYCRQWQRTATWDNRAASCQAVQLGWEERAAEAGG